MVKFGYENYGISQIKIGQYDNSKAYDQYYKI